MITSESETYKNINPLLSGHTEGLHWDFKETITDTAEIIKDILAFSNSSYSGDSYIIVGVSEADNKSIKKIKLCSADRKRLETDAQYIYLADKIILKGINAKDLESMHRFSQELTQKLTSCMLISQPEVKFVPIQIKRTRWLYVIIVKKIPGVFISNKDIQNKNDQVVVKQGVFYIRTVDTTTGNGTGNIAPAGEHIRIWKQYINHLYKKALSRKRKQ